MKYVKCPRCDLNYMPETEKYCDVCKAELKLGPTMKFVSFGDDEDSDQILCPVCKRNYIDPGEEMCAECKEEKSEKAAIEPEQDVDPDCDEEWRNYLDEDEKEAISNKVEDGEEILSLDKLGEDEAKELFDDEEEEDSDYYDNEPKEDEDDDFDYPDADESDFEDFDESEDDEDEEDDEEDF